LQQTQQNQLLKFGAKKSPHAVEEWNSITCGLRCLENKLCDGCLLSGWEQAAAKNRLCCRCYYCCYLLIFIMHFSCCGSHSAI